MAYDFDEYYFLRENFINTLDSQYSINSSSNPYDPTGVIGRMASRGDSKTKIIELLEANPVYVKNKELSQNMESIEDPIERAVLFTFKELEKAVSTLGDPPAPINIREMAAKALEESYEGTDEQAKMIRDGAPAVDILKSLDSVSSWASAERDFLTKEDVEYVQSYQVNRWATFKDILDIIKDLDLYN
jgi:hypothetical protein